MNDSVGVNMFIFGRRRSIFSLFEYQLQFTIYIIILHLSPAPILGHLTYNSKYINLYFCVLHCSGVFYIIWGKIRILYFMKKNAIKTIFKLVQWAGGSYTMFTVKMRFGGRRVREINPYCWEKKTFFLQFDNFEKKQNT